MSTSRTTICSPAEVLTYLGKGATATDQERGLVEMLMPLVDGAIKTFLGWNVIQTTYTHLLPDHDLFAISYNDLGIPIDVVQNRISYAFPGSSVQIQLPEIPVRQITSLYADYSSIGGQNAADFPANTLQVQGVDFYVDYDGATTTDPVPYTNEICWTGHIRRWIGTWPARQRAIKVTYVAGLSPDELDGKTQVPYRRVVDIKYASVLACAAAFNQARAQQVNLGAQGVITSERIGDAQFTYDADAQRQMYGMMSELPFACQQLLRKHQRVIR